MRMVISCNQSLNIHKVPVVSSNDKGCLSFEPTSIYFCPITKYQDMLYLLLHDDILIDDLFTEFKCVCIEHVNVSSLSAQK